MFYAAVYFGSHMRLLMNADLSPSRSAGVGALFDIVCVCVCVCVSVCGGVCVVGCVCVCVHAYIYACGLNVFVCPRRVSKAGC